MKVRDTRHDLLPKATPDDVSRQQAVVALRRVLNSKLYGRNSAYYASEGAPEFAAATGRAPQSFEEVEAAFFMSPHYRMWSALNRSAQEMLWIAVGIPIVRSSDEMAAAYARLSTAPGRLGALHLKDDLAKEATIDGVDVHLQPGGYTLDRGDADVAAGAFYETGGNMYSFGLGGGKGDSKSGCAIRWLEAKEGWVPPRRILEIGCSAGAATAHYAAHFPDAEVHGVDMGAGLLRYAHARAESLGVPVIFHQMDAGDLAFADESFDLIISHNLLHEISGETRRAMMRETYRLLAPGGLTLHQDVPLRLETKTMVEVVEKAWDVRFNNEPYWLTYGREDVAADLTAAGFPEVRQVMLPKLDAPGGWFAVVAEKPVRSDSAP
jgi:SAM-dependent methyltransferase